MRHKTSKYELLFVIIILLFTFQSALEGVWHGFSYIDELTGCMAFLLLPLHFGRMKKKLGSRTVLFAMMAMSLFILSGLTANFLYGYQPIALVAKDILANVKFYLTITTGYLLFAYISWDTLKKSSNWAARAATIILFLVFLADRIFNLYGGQVRHGIRSAELFYFHSTYLSGALAFLLTILAIFYKKRNWIFIGMDVIIMVFTMRSKAIAAALIYLFLFWHILIRKKTLKIWQLAFAAITAICLAGEQIYFYYIRLAGLAARSIMTITSFKILKDFFPIGTGFATFASHSAAERYSPVYLLYGFTDMWDVSCLNPNAFLDDTFWPIVVGQTGFIGTVSYLFVILLLIYKCFQLKQNSAYVYMGSVFMIAYLLISSIAEPTFNNSVSIPLGFLLGVIFRNAEVPSGHYVKVMKKGL